MKNLLKLALGTILVAHFTACGTILYPERKGQRGGQLDVGVVLLDAIGLLFFIIPGVICFAVDFSTGTIYFPPDHKNGRLELKDLERVSFDAKTQGPAILEKAREDRMRVTRLKSTNDMLTRFSAL